jgi:hypothetical protein
MVDSGEDVAAVRIQCKDGSKAFRLMRPAVKDKSVELLDSLFVEQKKPSEC